VCPGPLGNNLVEHGLCCISLKLASRVEQYTMSQYGVSKLSEIFKRNMGAALEQRSKARRPD